MKCDVCQTKIPLGSNECPNCGYKVRKESYNTFSVNSADHAHILTGTKKQITNKKKVIQPRSHVKKKMNVSLLIFIILLSGSIVGLMDTLFESIFFNPDDYSIQEAIEEGYDKDGTLQMALDAKDDFYDLIDRYNMNDIDIYDYWNNDDDILSATDSIHASLDDTEYNFHISFLEASVTYKAITICFESNESMRTMKSLPINENLLKDISQYYEGKDIMSMINEKRALMTAENESINSYNDGAYSLREEYEDNHYYCEINFFFG